jgi:hypothetical protein
MSADDEHDPEQAALEREVLEQAAADQAAFRARFKLKAFIEIAHALKMQPDAANLSRLARQLLAVFFTFYDNRSENRPSSREVAARLVRLRDAAKLLTSPEALVEMPCGIDGDGHFFDTASELARFWDIHLQRACPKRGRPRRSAFHELVADLARVYERLTGSPAKRPGVLRGRKAAYGSAFNAFAIAVWRCLMQNIREVHAALPPSETAVSDTLRKN